MPEIKIPFLRLTPLQVTPRLQALFSRTDPASVRCFAVLGGRAAGKVFTDDPVNPTWAVLQEATFGSLYIAGDVQPVLLDQLVADLRQDGDVLVGLRPDDPRWKLLPPTPDYSGYVREFTDRIAQFLPPEIPEGCRLQQLDHSLSKQILGRNLLIHMYGSIQQALEWGYGLCLLRNDELLCEAFAGPSANGVIEIGVETNPHHQRKGYASLTCSHLIQQMELRGLTTYWNCASQNLPSVALARKLGYKSEKEYPLMAWFKNQ